MTDKILFVDDDPNLLSGIQRQFQAMRERLKYWIQSMGIQEPIRVQVRGSG